MTLSEKFLDRALGITGKFEGKGFDQITGNFDGMGVSAGILQWNYGMGSLQEKILRPYIVKHGADAMDKSFPSKISHSATMGTSQGIEFAKKNMLTGTSVLVQWKAAWQKFLLSPEVMELQKAGCAGVAAQAQKICSDWGMSSLRSFAWGFDVATQNGSVKIPKPKYSKALMDEAVNFSVKNRALWSKMRVHFTPEQDVLMIASYLRAKLSNPQWQQDVMDRKGTIAAGEGIVHGTMFKLDFEGEPQPIEKPAPAPAPSPSSMPPWLAEAKKYSGKVESDPAFQAFMNPFWAKIGLPGFKGLVGSARAWCALFVFMGLVTGGYQTGKLNAAAISGDNVGNKIEWKTNGIPRGAIVRINHSSNCSTSSGNHIGFADGDCAPADLLKPGASFNMFGGNQGDAAKVSSFPVNDICSVSWPKADAKGNSIPLPGKVVKSANCSGSSGVSSTK